MDQDPVEGEDPADDAARHPIMEGTVPRHRHHPAGCRITGIIGARQAAWAA